MSNNQQLQFNIVNQVIGSEKIDQFKQKINTIPSDFGKINQVSTGLKDKINDAFNGTSVGGFLNLLGNIPGPIKAVVAATVLLKQGLDFAILGEKVNAVGIRFDRMAESAGLAGASVKKGLIDATSGLIDDEDALEIATRSISALGANASKLPEILNLSRNVAKSLGKDFKETFDNLSGFIENGNIKAIRQYGIALDLKTAYEQAAKAAGLTPDKLTNAQEQQIRLNLILDQTAPKFSRIADSITPISDAMDRLKVSSSNLFEDTAGGFAEFVARNLIDENDLSNVGTTRVQNQYSELSDEVLKLESRLKRLNEERFGARGVSEVAAYAQSISETSDKLRRTREEAQKLLIELSGRSDDQLFRDLDASRNTKQPVKIEKTPEQIAAIAEEAKKKQIEASKKHVEQLRREENQIDRFKESQISQMEIEKFKIDNLGKSRTEVEQLTVAMQLRNQAEIMSIGYNEKSKQKLMEVTEELIKQREELAKISESQNSFSNGAQQAWSDYLDQAKDAFGQSRSLAQRALGSIEDSLVELATTGKASFASLRDAIIQDMTRIAIRQATLGLTETIGSFFAGFGSAGGGGGGSAGQAAFAYANGGIMSSKGNMPLNYYSSGGIANSPQMAVFGEGRMAEAYVPLPDGRSIPVSMKGGGGGSVFKVNVSVDASGNSQVSGDKEAKRLGDGLAVAVKTVLIQEMRPGGLLSS